jgi:hypothetical protein
MTVYFRGPTKPGVTKVAIDKSYRSHEHLRYERIFRMGAQPNEFEIIGPGVEPLLGAVTFTDDKPPEIDRAYAIRLSEPIG